MILLLGGNETFYRFMELPIYTLCFKMLWIRLIFIWLSQNVFPLMRNLDINVENLYFLPYPRFTPQEKSRTFIFRGKKIYKERGRKFSFSRIFVWTFDWFLTIKQQLRQYTKGNRK